MYNCKNQLFEYLPFLLSDILGQHTIRSSLAATQGSVVVAEKIPRVPDLMNAPRCLVGFFVYYPNGDVVRCHPNREEHMRVDKHVMKIGSSLFSLATARAHGVGQALHRIPPAWVELPLAPPQGAVPRTAVTREHVAQFFNYGN